MSEETNYKQRVENYKKFFKYWSNGTASIEIDNVSYFAYTDQEFKDTMKSKDYIPYNFITSKITHLNNLHNSILRKSDELVNQQTEEQEAALKDSIYKLDTEYQTTLKLITEVVQVFNSMGIIRNWDKRTDDDFWIEWTHGYEPVKQIEMDEDLKQALREDFAKYKPVSMTNRMYKYFKMADIDLSTYEQAVNDNGTYWKLK